MQKVLIAEDDLMIADMAEELLIEHGYEVCGIVRTVADAVSMALLNRPDLIVIDMRLADGGLGPEIAAQLKSLPNLGILYASGNIAEIMLTAANGHACLSKPYRGTDLLRALKIVGDIVATGEASGPFPRGFQLLPLRIGAAEEFPPLAQMPTPGLRSQGQPEFAVEDVQAAF